MHPCRTKCKAFVDLMVFLHPETNGALCDTGVGSDEFPLLGFEPPGRSYIFVLGFVSSFFPYQKCSGTRWAPTSCK